jgi:LmbE family N-acetylglucosaminyl deacetylase
MTGRPATAIVLSPHSDDAAFSLAGTIKALIDTGASVLVLTCFSRSGFVRDGSRDPDIVTPRRQDEDRAFIELLGPRCVGEWMELPEAILRGMRLGEVLTDRPLLPDEESLQRQLTAAFAVRLTAGTLLYVPLGIGAHIDHRLVRDAGIAAAAETRATLAFYEDLPYAATCAPEVLEAVIHAVATSVRAPLEARFMSCGHLIAFKREAAMCYPSQLSIRWLDAIVRHAAAFDDANGMERLWCPA